MTGRICSFFSSAAVIRRMIIYDIRVPSGTPVRYSSVAPGPPVDAPIQVKVNYGSFRTAISLFPGIFSGVSAIFEFLSFCSVIPADFLSIE